ncbi:MAG: chemotaxis protein CheW [Candidatus Muiribacteriaceae bacterium]
MSPGKKSTVKGKDVSTLAGKYLTFSLGDETYGIEILKVQEIIGMMKVTHFPKAPFFVRGVINLRGKVIPVIDLRIKFDLPEKEDTEKTCIIVIQLESGESEVREGLIVDEVAEVLDIEESMIELSPSFGTDVDLDFIMGVGKVNEKVVILLDVAKILTGDEFNLISNVGGDDE